MSNLSLPCRYCCLKQREQSLPAQTEQWQEKTACLTMLQSRRKQQLWSHYSFIYGDCKLSLGVFFYLTVGSSWWGAEVWKSTQVHILFMVNFSGKTGPSLLSFPQAGNVSWSNWMFDDGRERSSEAVKQMVYVVDEAWVQQGLQPLLKHVKM